MLAVSRSSPPNSDTGAAMSRTSHSLHGLIAALCMLAVAGCSSVPDFLPSFTTSDAPAVAAAPRDIDLYLSRSSLSGTDFEHYTVTVVDSSTIMLLRECGAVERGRYVIREQISLPLEAPLREEIFETVSALEQQIQGSKHSFDPPGTNKNLFDPGQAVLKIAPQPEVTPGVTVETALDSLREPKGLPEKKILTIAKLLRSVGVKDADAAPVICGHNMFYGIGWKRG